jgi:hypothetical protein
MTSKLRFALGELTSYVDWTRSKAGSMHRGLRKNETFLLTALPPRRQSSIYATVLAAALVEKGRSLPPLGVAAADGCSQKLGLRCEEKHIDLLQVEPFFGLTVVKATTEQCECELASSALSL